MALIIMGIGAAGVGVQATFLSNLNAYAQYHAIVSSIAGLNPSGLNLIICLAGAAVVIAGGALAMLATISSKKCCRVLYVCCNFLAIIGGIVQIVGGVIVSTSSFTPALGPNTYIFNEQLPNEQLSGDQETMALFSLAGFEGCCRPNGWVEQGPFGNCSLPCPSSQSGELLDPTISTLAKGLDLSLLCTCVVSTSQARYSAMLSAMTPPVCSALTQVQLYYDPTLQIPTTSITVGTVMSQLFPSAIIDRLPLVGFPKDSGSDPTRKTITGFGFGCGFGYQKGFMWYQQIYNQQVVLPGGTAGLGLGAAAIGVVFLNFLLAWLFAHEDADETWDRSLAANWNQPLAMKKDNPAPFAESVSSSNPIAGANVKKSAEDDKLFNDLLKFYAKYDTKKTPKDIDLIISWTKQNGISALNKRLRDKYKVDLSGTTSKDMESPPV